MGKILRRGIGCLCILCGLVCFLYPKYQDYRICRTVDTMVEWPEESGTGQRSKMERMPELYEAMRLYNQKLCLEGQNFQEEEKVPGFLSAAECLEETDGALGYIEIPDMGVCLPVFPGATGEHLARGAAIMDQTSMPLGGAGTNCVIAGHSGYRVSHFFQYMDHMKEGSEVTLVNPWETLRYQAVETKVIDPCDWEDLKICPDKDRLTLISCHPYGGGGRYRYLVLCERITGGRQERSALAPEAALGHNLQKGAVSFGNVKRMVEGLLPVVVCVAAGWLILKSIRNN